MAHATLFRGALYFSGALRYRSCTPHPKACQKLKSFVKRYKKLTRFAKRYSCTLVLISNRMGYHRHDAVAIVKRKEYPDALRRF